MKKHTSCINCSTVFSPCLSAVDMATYAAKHYPKSCGSVECVSGTGTVAGLSMMLVYGFNPDTCCKLISLATGYSVGVYGLIDGPRRIFNS